MGLSRTSDRIECCGTCEYCGLYPSTDVLVCWNPESEGYGGMVDPNDYCGEWEKEFLGR